MNHTLNLKHLAAVSVFAALGHAASAQSFNVEWESLDSSPPTTYTTVPAPSALTLLAATGLLAPRRRRA